MKAHPFLKLAGVALTAATLASASWASPTVTYAEAINALGEGTGDLVATAQTVTGTSGATRNIRITGNFADARGGQPQNGVDLYAVSLDQGGLWSFDSFGSAVADTQLFLFDATGLGVRWNQDASVSPVETLSRFTAYLASGTYYLGVSLFGWDAQDSGSASIFDTLDNGGDANPAAGALAGWVDFSGGGTIDIGRYTLNAAFIPTPGALALVLAGLGLMAGVSARTRRNAA